VPTSWLYVDISSGMVLDRTTCKLYERILGNGLDYEAADGQAALG
jgi:hypothetical protein